MRFLRELGFEVWMLAVAIALVALLFLGGCAPQVNLTKVAAAVHAQRVDARERWEAHQRYRRALVADVCEQPASETVESLCAAHLRGAPDYGWRDDVRVGGRR